MRRGFCFEAGVVGGDGLRGVKSLNLRGDEEAKG